MPEARGLLLGDAHFIGSRRGIVYIGCSRSASVAYIGQTAGQTGVLGRWAHHLSSSTSSFWRRIEERGGCEPGAIEDLAVFASGLGVEPHWNGVESSHREAVEYLVQVRLQAVCGDLDPFLRIISHVRPNLTCQLPFVRTRAEAIAAEFVAWYEV